MKQYDSNYEKFWSQIDASEPRLSMHSIERMVSASAGKRFALPLLGIDAALYFKKYALFAVGMLAAGAMVTTMVLHGTPNTVATKPVAVRQSIAQQSVTEPGNTSYTVGEVKQANEGSVSKGTYSVGYSVDADLNLNTRANTI